MLMKLRHDQYPTVSTIKNLWDKKSNLLTMRSIFIGVREPHFVRFLFLLAE